MEGGILTMEASGSSMLAESVRRGEEGHTMVTEYSILRKVNAL